MYSFKNDYSEGAHPRILQTLIESNLEQEEGYGKDSYSLKAIELLKQKMESNNVDIHLFTGGTQTNLTVISAFLRPYEAAITADTGHIWVHETGSIEATGHKVFPIESKDGKLIPSQIKAVLDLHPDEHMVKPRLVYISNSTEIGTTYNKFELKALRVFCKENNLLLFMDGARLGSALCSEGNDLDLKDLPELVDAFYIGGTKNGALLGEALVICNEALKENFRFNMKQKGALLAKGKLLGVQFYELFKDDLFFELAQNANNMASLLREGLKEEGLEFLIESASNQIFPILPNTMIEELEKKYFFIIWSKVNQDNSAVRLVTSWATKEDAVLALLDDIKSC